MLENKERAYKRALEEFQLSRSLQNFDRLRLADVNFRIELRYAMERMSPQQKEVEQKRLNELQALITHLRTQVKGEAKKLPKQAIPLAEEEKKKQSVQTRMELPSLERFLLKNQLQLIQIVDKYVTHEEKKTPITYHIPTIQERHDLIHSRRIIILVENTIDINGKRYYVAQTVDTYDLNVPPKSVSYMYIPMEIIRNLEQQGSFDPEFVLDRIVALARDSKNNKFAVVLFRGFGNEYVILPFEDVKEELEN